MSRYQEAIENLRTFGTDLAKTPPQENCPPANVVLHPATGKGTYAFFTQCNHCDLSDDMHSQAVTIFERMSPVEAEAAKRGDPSQEQYWEELARERTAQGDDAEGEN